MKTVLCFGDSLIWGFNPETGGRHNYEYRWTTLLDTLLIKIITKCNTC